ncbi:hypothetical protein BNJ_00226 [Kaumoebavirus]|uniref:hypothetical protein n=1 Tax=Kaumoebavirus TaxID=1859492 RepID=UPI0009C1C584|nr:hypothetical protein BNJ_00226 [Kaumoebavirus]ARA72055.1 hypothetical protein BNJ_00226 [Kaumoebavirus]
MSADAINEVVEIFRHCRCFDVRNSNNSANLEFFASTKLTSYPYKTDLIWTAKPLLDCVNGSLWRSFVSLSCILSNRIGRKLWKLSPRW